MASIAELRKQYSALQVLAERTVGSQAGEAASKHASSGVLRGAGAAAVHGSGRPPIYPGRDSLAPRVDCAARGILLPRETAADRSPDLGRYAGDRLVDKENSGERTVPARRLMGGWPDPRQRRGDFFSDRQASRAIAHASSSGSTTGGTGHARSLREMLQRPSPDKSHSPIVI